MSRLDDLVAMIPDITLRNGILSILSDMKKRQRFGLVFEEHIPEMSALDGLPIQPNSIVNRRDNPEAKTLYHVIELTSHGRNAIVQSVEGGEKEVASIRDLLVVKRFGEPIYPSLTPLGSVVRGGPNKPYHIVVNGENFHALQLFIYLFENQVDCIYIDPPYNTGARDWKYNNRYVDATDVWCHSKWLSFMEKRLRLARRLLKSDGVLIVTIDEHEIHHLGMLLERVYPEYLRYMVTIIINPKGTGKANFARVDEQAFFVVPDIGSDVILPRPVERDAKIEDFSEINESDIPNCLEDDEDLESNGIASDVEEDEDIIGEDELWEYQHARRRGSESSYRHQRPNQFYPIYIDEDAGKVIEVGKSIPLEEKPNFNHKNGLRPIWPIDARGDHRCWRFIPESMQQEIDAGNLFLGKYNSKRDYWTINIKRPRKQTKKLKTVWHRREYDAGTHGTELIRRLLGRPGLFPFPKSVYAVRDCLAAVVRNRPHALIVDFFAGSGTTFHATCLLNAEDGGRRRSVLVTNNEVAEKDARNLNKKGLYRGDPEFEAHGIFEQVTRPRCEAIITGHRPDGTPIPGKHVNGSAFSKGFEENIEFFKLDYLDPDELDLGWQFNSILPALWLSAGSIGPRDVVSRTEDFSIPTGSTYGVLFRETQFRKFKDHLEKHPEVRHVWLITDSEEAYSEMRSELPSGIRTSMLYRDYLRNFRINTEIKL